MLMTSERKLAHSTSKAVIFHNKEINVSGCRDALENMSKRESKFLIDNKKDRCKKNKL